MLQGALIGFVVAVVMLVWNRYQASRGGGLAGQVEQAMRGRGGLTLAEVAAAVGRDSFFGRGQVVQALGGLISIGKVLQHEAPAGTPQLEKVNHIRYELKA
ncbi:MAG: hypothetical protein U0324_32530 [Polyangiales bacterium]